MRLAEFLRSCCADSDEVEDEPSEIGLTPCKRRRDKGAKYSAVLQSPQASELSHVKLTPEKAARALTRKVKPEPEVKTEPEAVSDETKGIDLKRAPQPIKASAQPQRKKLKRNPISSLFGKSRLPFGFSPPAPPLSFHLFSLPRILAILQVHCAVKKVPNTFQNGVRERPLDHQTP